MASETCTPAVESPWLLILTGWALTAVLAGELRLLEVLPQGGIQGLILGLAAVLLVVWRASGGLRAGMNRVELRLLVAFHLLRFVGAPFVVLGAGGELPRAFAVPAVWGELAVALAALVLVLMPGKTRGWRLAVGLWNGLGFFGVLFLVVMTGRLASMDTGSLAALTRLPLSLLPTLLIPLLLFTHIVIACRCWRAG